jgi:hypothetical protein
MEPPALIVSGDDDPAHPREEMEDLAILSPHTDLEIIPGAGEAVMEDQPAAFVEVVTRWLKRARSRRMTTDEEALERGEATMWPAPDDLREPAVGTMPTTRAEPLEHASTSTGEPTTLPTDEPDMPVTTSDPPAPDASAASEAAHPDVENEDDPAPLPPSEAAIPPSPAVEPVTPAEAITPAGPTVSEPIGTRTEEIPTSDAVPAPPLTAGWQQTRTEHRGPGNQPRKPGGGNSHRLGKSREHGEGHLAAPSESQEGHADRQSGNRQSGNRHDGTGHRRPGERRHGSS